MRPLCIVEADPVFDYSFGLKANLQFMQVDDLLFERPPQPFDEDTVQTLASPIHRDFHVSLCQCGDLGRTCEVRSLVRIHNLWLAVFGDGLFQSLDTEAGVQRV